MKISEFRVTFEITVSNKMEVVVWAPSFAAAPTIARSHLGAYIDRRRAATATLKSVEFVEEFDSNEL